MRNKIDRTIFIVTACIVCLLTAYSVSDFFRLFNRERVEDALENPRDGEYLGIDVTLPDSIEVIGAGILPDGGWWVLTSSDSIKSSKFLSRYNLEGELVQQINFIHE